MVGWPFPRGGADAVVAGMSVAPLMRMLSAGALGSSVGRELRRWRYGLGSFKIDVALSAPVPWTSGPGVHGVCGAGAARAVQADASWVRPWRRPR